MKGKEREDEKDMPRIGLRGHSFLSLKILKISISEGKVHA